MSDEKKDKELEIKFGRNWAKAVVTYKRDRAIVSVKTTNGKKRKWTVKPEQRKGN